MDVSRTIIGQNVSSIISFRGTELPFGYLYCDGAYISRASYARLFEIIGTSYNLPGDTDSTKFRLPNFTDRIALCDSSTYVLGSSGGSDTETLLESQMPSHTHLQNAHTHSVLNFTNILRFSSPIVSVNYLNSSGSVSSTTATNQNAGGGAAHNNIMPSLYCFKIIKY